MESEQKETIRKNKSKLIDLTYCSAQFLSKFLEEGVLSSGDIESVLVEKKNKGRFDAATQFYSIVTTRKNAYAVLIEALKATGQTGAYDVLHVLRIESITANQTTKRFVTAPSYMTKFLENKTATCLVVFSQDCQITSRRIEENVDNCQMTNPEDLFQRLGNYRFSNSCLAIFTCNDNNELWNIINKACKRNLKSVFITSIYTEIDANIKLKQNKKNDEVMFVNDTLTWKDLSVDVQSEIFFQLERDLNFSKKEVEKEIEKIDYTTLVNLISGAILKPCKRTSNTWGIFENDIPEKASYYIQRKIISRTSVEIDIFKKHSNDIFLLAGVSKQEFELVTGKITETSSRLIQRKFKTETRFFIMDQSDHFVNICEHIKSRDVHLIEYNGKTFEWKKSNGSVKAIQQSLKKSQPIFDETEFVQRIFRSSKLERKAVCISDTPGMGKSVLLANIARTLDAIIEDGIVCFLTISSLVETVEQLSQINFEAKVDLVEREICRHACLNNIGSLYLRKNKGILKELLLDGFDELPNTNEKFGFELIRILYIIYPNIRIWITTRPHFLQKLENELTVPGFNILPFTETDQINFLTSFWAQTQNGIVDIPKLEYFAHWCLNNVKSTIDAQENDIAGVPLQCLLIGEIFEDDAISHLKSSKDDVSECLSAISPIRHIIEMYEKLVDKKITKFYSVYTRKLKKPKRSTKHRLSYRLFSKYTTNLFEVSRPMDVTRQELIDAHIYLSLNHLFPSIEDDSQEILKLKSIPIYHLLNVGIVETSLFMGNVSFIHRTFAEYFVAYFVVQILTTKSTNHNIVNILKTIFESQYTPVILPNAYIESVEFRHYVICYFVDAIFRKLPKCSLNMGNIFRSEESKLLPKIAKGCISGNFLKIFVVLFADQPRAKHKKRPSLLDDLLILASFYGNVPILKLCSILKDPSSLFLSTIRKGKYTLLHFSVYGGKFEMVKHFCEVDNFKPLLTNDACFYNDLIYTCVKETEHLNEKNLMEKKQILLYLVNINQNLLMGENYNGKSLLECRDIGLSLMEVLFNLIRQYEYIVVYFLNRITTERKTTKEYIKVLNSILIGKDDDMLSLNPRYYSSPLLHAVFAYSKPDVGLLEELLLNKITFKGSSTNESLFEIAVRSKISNTGLCWLMRHINLTAGNVKAVLLDLFRNYSYNTIEQAFNMTNFDLNCKLFNGNSILHVLFCKEENQQLDKLRMCRFLVERGVSVNSTNDKKETPLHHLVMCQPLQPYCWDYLVDNGANSLALNIENEDPVKKLFNSTILQESYRNPAVSFLELRDIQGNYVLHYAAQASNYDMIKYFTSVTNAATLRNHKGETPLHILALQASFAIECWKDLVNNGADPLLEDVDGKTPISNLIATCSESKLFLNVMDTLSWNSPSKIKQMIWLVVSSLNHFVVKKICSRYTEKITEGSHKIINNKQTLLDAAVINPDSQVVVYVYRELGCTNLLCDLPKAYIHNLVTTPYVYGMINWLEYICTRDPALVNSLNDIGLVPLSVDGINPYFVKPLVKLGADVNAQDANGNTSLHWALRNVNNSKRHLLLQILIDCDADANVANAVNETTLIPVSRILGFTGSKI